MTAMLQRFLAQYQVDTQTVWSVAEARALLAQHAFRVVVTDRFALSEAGLALLRDVCQMAPETRVILMTAFGAPAFHHQACAAGAYACLAKPFRLQAFWEVIQHALQGDPAPEAKRHDGQGSTGRSSWGKKLQA